MTEAYKILYRGGQDELVEKRSRFIAVTRPVKTEEQAQAFIEEMRKKYWDARHCCSAYVLGERGQTARCSDDGEPAQTAGRPMLDVLLSSGVRDVCLVVIRYFGGVLLGTGGLVRAYSSAAQKGLAASVVAEKIPGRRLVVKTDYNGAGKLQYTAAQEEFLIENTEYTDQVTMTFLLPLADCARAQKLITERTAGRARAEDGGDVSYALVDGKPVLFE